MLEHRDVIVKLVDVDPVVFKELREHLYPSVEDSRNMIVSTEDVGSLIWDVKEGNVRVSKKTLEFLKELDVSTGYGVEFIWISKV